MSFFRKPLSRHQPLLECAPEGLCPTQTADQRIPEMNFSLLSYTLVFSVAPHGLATSVTLTLIQMQLECNTKKQAEIQKTRNSDQLHVKLVQAFAEQAMWQTIRSELAHGTDWNLKEKNLHESKCQG